MLSKKEVRGEKPHQYSYKKTRKFSEEVVVQLYNLVTGDSFEVGGAYSLHLSTDNVRSFLPDHWWQRIRKPETIYVSRPTLDEMIKKEDKVIFKSWEN